MYSPHGRAVEGAARDKIHSGPLTIAGVAALGHPTLATHARRSDFATSGQGRREGGAEFGISVALPCGLRFSVCPARKYADKADSHADDRRDRDYDRSLGAGLLLGRNSRVDDAKGV